MSDRSTQEIRAWIEQLASEGFLDIGTEYRTFSLSEKAHELLRGECDVHLVARPEHAGGGRRTRSSRPVSRAPIEPMDDGDVDQALYASLRELRNSLAAERNVPGYCVLSNKTLQYLAQSKPQDESALLSIPGIGPKKIAQYGEAFIDLLRGGSPL